MAQHIIVESAEKVRDRQANLFFFAVLIVVPIMLIVISNSLDIPQLFKIGIIWSIISIIIISLYVWYKIKKKGR